MEAPKVVVVGSTVVDFAYAVEMLPMPGESAPARAVVRRMGGKGANQAAAAARLGARTSLIGCVGDDGAGADSRADLEALGVGLALRTTADRPTGSAAVLVDDEGENAIAVHLGANLELSPDDVAAAGSHFDGAHAVVTQLEIPLEAVRAAGEAGREREALTVLNAAPVDMDAVELFPLFDIIVVNRMEAEVLAGVGISTVDDALAAQRALRDMGAADAVVTLGAAGAVYSDHGRGVHARAPKIEAVDSTGTGDAFVGALAVFRAEGLDMSDAVAYACCYAADSATRPGTRSSFPLRADVTFPES